MKQTHAYLEKYVYINPELTLREACKRHLHIAAICDNSLKFEILEITTHTINGIQERVSIHLEYEEMK